MKCRIMMKLHNWNDIIKQCRANKFGANKHKKDEMKGISYFIYKTPVVKKYPVKMVFTWHIKNSNSDLDNKSVKSILDEMQNLGIIENDNIKHINEISHIAIQDVEDYVEVEIIENDSIN